eukprot:jgi/Chlat1/3531/Chrsp23S03802
MPQLGVLLLLGLLLLVGRVPLHVKASNNDADYDAVKADIRTFLLNSRPEWPADFGNYGPASDGRGGCDGARIRHLPEHGWPDNVNLDKALSLLSYVKSRHPSISWGDLIVLAGTTAIESLGGPVLGFCGGRRDDADGEASLELGPTPEQEAIAPCPVNGKCVYPLGPTTIGLIYVNPEGPLGVPNPDGSVVDIRSSFGRMGMDDRETVALIGGGHAVGKVHGACPTGAGPGPLEDPVHPWPGTCGTPGTPTFGKGNNTFSSGFEGPWTTDPTIWDNEYFHNLLNFNWNVHIGPGGKHQWAPSAKPNGPPVPAKRINMLTSDIALLRDPSYKALVEEFAKDAKALGDTFAHAWYKLVTRDMGPVTRCVGNSVPPAQPFQDPLPPPKKGGLELPQVQQRARELIKNSLYTHANAAAVPGDLKNTYYGALLATGGCDGARIRLSPQSDWPSNAGLAAVIESVLGPIKQKLPAATSWADLIVLAGNVALEEGWEGPGSLTLKFCPGRSDATDGTTSEDLSPRPYYTDAIVAVRDSMKVSGFTPRELVALSTKYFAHLLAYDWEPVSNGTTINNQLDPNLEWQAKGKQGIYATAYDLALIWDTEYKAIVQEFAVSPQAFKRALVRGWTKIMNADRFDGPDGNLCKS